MNKLIKEKIEEFVYQELGSDYSGHDFNHAKRVYNNAIMIMESIGKDSVNENVVLTAALIHDCIDHKLYKDIDLQINKIKCLLFDLAYNENEIKLVIELISNLSYSKNIAPETIEAKILSDCDRLDAIGAIGIVRTIEYGAANKRKFYGNDNSTINHFYDKLFKLKDLMYTDKAKEIAEKRHQFMIDFIKEFDSEIKN